MYSITVYHIKSSSEIRNVRFMYDHLKWKHPEPSFLLQSICWFFDKMSEQKKKYKIKLNRKKNHQQLHVVKDSSSGGGVEFFKHAKYLYDSWYSGVLE